MNPSRRPIEPLHQFWRYADLKKYGRRIGLKRAKWRRRHQPNVRLSLRAWKAIDLIEDFLDEFDDAFIESETLIVDPERILAGAR